MNKKINLRATRESQEKEERILYISNFKIMGGGGTKGIKRGTPRM